jgi:hypothetical protein
MPPINRVIQRCLERVERRMGLDGRTPPAFTWVGSDGTGAKEIPCVPSSVGRQVVIDPSGNEIEIDLTLIVRREQFTTMDSTLITIDSELYTMDNDTPTPVSGRTLVFRGVTYRVITAKESGPQSHFELTLKEAGSNG